MNARRFAALAAMLLVSGSAAAAEVDGAALAAWWGVPFAGMLLSIALMPLLAPKVWHHHYGKIAAGWALAFMVPMRWRSAPGRRAGRSCMRWWPSTSRSSSC